VAMVALGALLSSFGLRGRRKRAAAAASVGTSADEAANPLRQRVS
jgi:hypothetical protein